MSEKRSYDFLLTIDNKDKSVRPDLLGTFSIKAGRAKESGNPYIFLQGFSKTMGKGLMLNIKPKLDVLIAAACDAGFGDQIAEVLASKGVIGEGAPAADVPPAKVEDTPF
jgi:hypothetical protein